MKTLVNFVQSVKGCQFGNIEYISEGGIPKKVINGVVTKLVKAQIQFNYNYANAVNNRLANSGCEANFEADKLPWGEWLIPNKVITHKDSLYIRYYDYEGAKVESIWFVDGKPATSEQMDVIVGYLRSKNTESKKQAEHGLTSHQVKPKVVKAVNILSLTLSGKTYKRDYRVAL
jgi:hypothetical protein